MWWIIRDSGLLCNASQTYWRSVHVRLFYFAVLYPTYFAPLHGSYNAHWSVTVYFKPAQILLRHSKQRKA